MTIVVGGHTRNVGKTRAVCEIISATREALWTAIKISRHGHGAELTAPVIVEDQEPGEGTDTGRYLLAGAARAFWVRARPEHTAQALGELTAAHRIIESTSVVEAVEPDVFVLLEDPSRADWKESAVRLAGRATHRCGPAELGPVIGEIRTRLKETGLIR